MANLSMRLGAVALGVFMVSVYGCGTEPESGPESISESQQELGCPDNFTASEWRTINTMSPIPDLPVDTTNKYADSAAAAALGQALFFDPRIAGPIQNGTPAEGQLGAIGDKFKIACANCHMPASGWLFDIRSNNGGPIPNATALGSDWMSRNVSSLVNTVFYVQGHGRSAPHWRENDGFSDSEWFDAQSEPEGAPVQNGSRLQLAHLIFDHYHDLYNRAFPEWPLNPAIANLSRFPATGSPFTDVDNWNGMAPGDQEIINRVLTNYGKGMEAHLRTLISRNAPFDRFVAGDRHAINSSAQNGLKLFVGKAGCVGCHAGPIMSDDNFHNTGLQINTTLSPHAAPGETGRNSNQAFICNSVDSEFNVNGPYSDDRHTGRLNGFCDLSIPNNLWRTKELRQIAHTAPYMRDGQLATLEDVIDFYDRGGDPADANNVGPREIHQLHLSHQEKQDLIAFLGTLTGDPVPAARLVDTHRP
jgi:cytochrome c peroxidase